MKNIFTLFVGTYGNEIFRYSFNIRTLEAVPDGSAKVENGSYLAAGSADTDPENRPPSFIYALTESGSRSAVHALGNDMGMSRINTERSVGKDPCYVIHYRNHVITADYSGGSISVFPTAPDGALLPPVQTIRFTGKSVHPLRQQSSHIHTVRVVPPLTPDGVSESSPSQRFLLATDLGSDRIHILKITGNEPASLRLIPANPAFIPVPQGSGPRHIAFHPGKNMLYVLAELSGMILVFRMKETAGELILEPIQEIETDTAPGRAGGDIHISPDGRFLYASNRNANDGIFHYRISAQDGTLACTGFTPTGRHPRSFLITPDGSLLLAACKNDKLIQIFRIDTRTGALTGPLRTIGFERDEPVCLIAAPARR